MKMLINIFNKIQLIIFLIINQKHFKIELKRIINYLLLINFYLEIMDKWLKNIKLVGLLVY